MSYIKYDKTQLINLEYSLSKELLRSNRAGAFANTTIIGCNTRKYHGLLITPQPGVDGGMHVLLSTLDETVIQHEAAFNLALHKFKGDIYLPKGHKYIRDFTTEPIPKLTYRVGGVVLTKEILFSSKDDLIMIRYTLVDAHSPTILRFKPFLAYRNIHSLTRSNIELNNRYTPVENGISMLPYEGYTPIYMQFSKEAEYTHVPDWYFNLEYSREKERGFDHLEDLFVPGFFEVPIEKGESIIFSAGIFEIKAGTLDKLFNAEVNRRVPRDSFGHCLDNSAQQFIEDRAGKTYILSGFPWHGVSARNTFISLPGLLLVNGDSKTFTDVVRSMVSEMQGPLFPSFNGLYLKSYNSADAPLWFFWALQQYERITGDSAGIWKDYGSVMKKIIDGYKEGTLFNLRLLNNGLVYAGEPGNALTWMDARVAGNPVTPRTGVCVEINALWYNALRYIAALAGSSGSKELEKEYSGMAAHTRESFLAEFWIPGKNILADYINGDFRDTSLRPNQLFAVSMPYSMLSEEQMKSVVDLMQKELLTERGLRTLSPRNPLYKGDCHGNEYDRGNAYHQGTVWPWLIGHFAEAYLRVYGYAGIGLIKRYYDGFEPVMQEAGIGTISEVYDGDPPQQPGGGISYAPNVAELLRTRWLLENGGKIYEIS